MAISLAVAAIPEGLPAVITTCLALGTRKMAKKNAIVRRLPSVETLGCTSIICSDKTGTLTTNEMTVTDFVFMGSKTSQLEHYEVEGHSYEPKGDIKGFHGELLKQNHSLQELVGIMANCNESIIEYKDGTYRALGAPTEAAIRILVEKLGKYDPEFSSEDGSPMAYNDHVQKSWKKYATLEFTRDRKAMSVIANKKGESNHIQIKGAPDFLLKKCGRVLLGDGTVVPITDQLRKEIMEHIDEMANKALRCIGHAYKDDSDLFSDYDGLSHPNHNYLTDTSKYAEYEDKAIFVGLVAMRDPPRPEVPFSIEVCKMAGIRVCMITGDNQNTANAIARDVGIFEEDEEIEGKSFTGTQLEAMSNEEVKGIFKGEGGRVFSRTEPRHKRRLVQVLQEMKEVCAMTGDGVNDAPALKQASIGIAMGISGTEVAKEASDMVLADDNFATIVSAVCEGRSIYSNTKAFIRYLISSNIGEVASIFLTAMLGIPESLTSVQLLWVNLVTDGLPATALGFNPPDLNIMSKPPRNSDEPLISGWVFFRYLCLGLYVGFATVGIFIYWYCYWAGYDGHTLITFNQLRTWGSCPEWDESIQFANFRDIVLSKRCDYFATTGKKIPMTLSLSVLVTIEMLNAINSVSEEGSLL